MNEYIYGTLALFSFQTTIKVPRQHLKLRHHPMKRLLLLAGLFTTGMAQAQITITQSDFVVAGDIIYQASDTNCSTPPGPGGASQTWNLTTIQNHQVDTSWFLNPAGQPGAAQFPDATIVQKMGDGSGGYFYGYYKITSTYVDLLGLTGNGFSLVYDIPYRQAVFPSTYNTAFTGTAKFHFSYAYPVPPYDSGKSVTTIDYDIKMDAWGDVTTPTATYASLRQRVATNQKDSTFLRNATTNQWVWDATPPNVTIDTGHTWVSSNKKFNVASVDLNAPGSTPAGSCSYLLSVVAGVNETQAAYGLKVYPNPFSSEAILESKQALRNGSLSILNAVGQEVKHLDQLKGTRIALRRDNLPAGIYFLRLSEGNQVVAVQKLVLVD